MQFLLILNELTILHIDLVEDALVLLVVIISGRINCFEKSLVLLSDFILLLLLGLDLSIDPSNFFLKLLEFLLISRFKFRHLQVSILLDKLSSLK